MTLAKSRCGVSSKKLLSWASMSGCMSPNPGVDAGSTGKYARRGDRLRGPGRRASPLASLAQPRPGPNQLARCKAAYSPHETLAACSRALLPKIPFYNLSNSLGDLPERRGESVRAWRLHQFGQHAAHVLGMQERDRGPH